MCVWVCLPVYVCMHISTVVQVPICDIGNTAIRSDYFSYYLILNYSILLSANNTS